MTLASVSLDDKYALVEGRAFMTGTQALVRLPLMQRRLDQANGLNTAGYISGYRGSPLGPYDQQLWQAKHFLEQHHIVFEPGLNEDLAATAVWGSQQLHLAPGAKYDGVFAIWYGKGPGVDRSGDVFRHMTMSGTSRHGGVLLALGDDHNAVSSTAAHQSDHNMISWMIPMLYPAGIQEYLDYGLLGLAMSRFAGVPVGFKCVSELVESSASVALDPARHQFVIPDEFEMPDEGLNIRWPDDRWQQEERLHLYKDYAALAFARANNVNSVVIDSPNPRIGIITTGKSYLDVRQALDDLGIDDQMAADIGIRLYKVGMPWPLEKEGVRHFAEGLEQVIVIEEKRAIIENQLKEQLYNWRADVRPRVVGKFDEKRDWLLPAHGELSPAMIARLLVNRFKDVVTSVQIEERMAVLEEKAKAAERSEPLLARTPYFCSGCPHNTSTKVPDGSRAMAGIGCHYMALWMDRHTEMFTQMGGEGVPWLGIAPFTTETHIFANLGDGTYHHSGLLAIRAAAASGANITYKILCNDAVAMTGGQPILESGQLTPWEISQQVYHEGVKRIVVTTDDPKRYPAGLNWAPGVEIRHRDELDRVQRELREVEGCTVLIHDQTCAAEKRRRRKRGTYPDPDRRAFINDLVCEGCGDCSVQSNCVSIEPLETEFGRKRQINQSSCNKDFSCLKGFCPSFVTVSGGAIRGAPKEQSDSLLEAAMASLPEPQTEASDQPYNILVTGIGGTGVVTVGALLGMAAHLEGKAVSVLDFTGLAQKNGAVLSHIRIADDGDQLHAVRIADGSTNLLLGCDLVVSGGEEALIKLEHGLTRAVVNSHEIPTADFTLDTDFALDTSRIQALIAENTGDNLVDFIDASTLATALSGNAISTNMFLLGFAAQRGLLPLSMASLMRAIELNGVAIEGNKRAFHFGRMAAHDQTKVEAAAAPSIVQVRAKPKTLDDLIQHRSAFLGDYQSADYAERYLDFVARVRAAEEQHTPGRDGLTWAVAENLAKLMAYKDEYEVARLYTSGEFESKLKTQFEGDLKLSFHLAPPLLSRRDPDTGHLKKREFGPWIFSAFRVLSKFKRLRGTALDIFGYSEERRTERQLIADYRRTIDSLLERLDGDNHALAAEIARVPEHIRGYGHIKEENIRLARAREMDLLAAFANPTRRAAAE